MKLILASQSPYRKKMLLRLGIAFEAKSPRFNEDDEKKNVHLNPMELAQYLARKKAESLAQEDFAQDKSDLLILGADQVVEFNGQVLGKPGSFDKAFHTLSQLSGKTHRLITSFCLIHHTTLYAGSEIAEVQMRNLSEQEIKSYLELDQPYDCAGSFKFEAAGIALIEKIACPDPSSIEGLPLIQLCTVLRDLNYPMFVKS